MSQHNISRRKSTNKDNIYKSRIINHVNRKRKKKLKKTKKIDDDYVNVQKKKKDIVEYND